MTTHITKTWVEDGKLITQVFEEKDIYKREWVGLTDMERQMIINKHDGVAWETTIAIEQQLKEKNV